MVISQGHVYWADLPDPTGSSPVFPRPVIVAQGDALNRSRIRTVVCVPLTSNLVWADAPGNVLLPANLNFSPVEKIKAALHGIKVVSSISYAKGEERPYGNRVYNRTNGISATGAAPSDREI